MANLIGAAVYFDQYYHIPGLLFSNSSSSEDSLSPAQTVHSQRGSYATTSEVDNTFTASPTTEGLCITQAFFAGYATLGSIFWTIFLSIYVYLYLLYHAMKPKVANCSLVVAYIVCYGTPLIITLWLALTDRLGYAPYNSSGWCSLIVQDPSTGEIDIYAVVLGNDLWIYLALFLIPILYFASRDYIHNNLVSCVVDKNARGSVSTSLLISLVVCARYSKDCMCYLAWYSRSQHTCTNKLCTYSCDCSSVWLCKYITIR